MTEEEFSKAQIRISGDGAKLSRISSFVVLSITILENNESVMSAHGHVYFIIKNTTLILLQQIMIT